MTVLRELEEDIDRDKLRQLLIYSKKLGTFEQKAKLVRDAIDEILEADDDLAAMYLTEKNHDILRGEDDHTEIEMLLESYHKLCDEIVQESGNLVSNIRNTEEMYFLTYLSFCLLSTDFRAASKQFSMPIGTPSCSSTSNSLLVHLESVLGHS